VAGRAPPDCLLWGTWCSRTDVACYLLLPFCAHRGLDIYKVNDLLSKQGWHLNALQVRCAAGLLFAKC